MRIIFSVTSAWVDCGVKVKAMMEKPTISTTSATRMMGLYLPRREASCPLTTLPATTPMVSGMVVRPVWWPTAPPRWS
jgi:hypothetical protein